MIVCYSRVSTDEQAQGLEAQRQALVAWAGDREVQWVTDSGCSGRIEPEDRPSLGPVLRSMRRGDVLAVSKLDRCSRSLAHFAALVERASDAGWSIVCLDVGVDTGTPAGEMMVNVMASFARYERRLISERTRAAYHARRATGWRVGHQHDAKTEQQVWDLADERLSQRGIADRMGMTRNTVTRILARRP